MKSSIQICAALAALTVAALSSPCSAQIPGVTQQQAQAAGLGSGLGTQNTRAIPPFEGPPAGVKALPIDLFTSKNFYKDQPLWSDKRYYRCNSPRELVESLWESGRIGIKPPDHGLVGRLQHRLPAREHRQSVPVQDGKIALRSVARRSQGTRRSCGLYQGDDA